MGKAVIIVLRDEQQPFATVANSAKVNLPAREPEDYRSDFHPVGIGRVSHFRHGVSVVHIENHSKTVLYAAGTDSTYSILSSFFLASTLHPEVNKAAREEIDRVVGRDRLPTFDDRESLPYIEALLKEVLRWNPAAPLAPSHQILVDDVYDGFLIPAGTILHPNIWSMTHNEEMYPNPFEFKPERFLGLDEERAKEIDPKNFVFGFGRRVCIGQFFADQQIWLVIASLVATFDISKAKDKFGEEITPVPNYPHFVGKPDPFKCVVTLRDATAARLIEEATTES